MGISIRAYGRHRGVSDAAVRKAIKAGRITPEPDGTIDPERADAEWKRNTDVAQQRGEQKRKATQTQRKAVPQAALNAVAETLTEQGTPGGGTTYMQARAANEVLKAQTARIRLQQLKKELVDRSKALAHVFRLARQERDAWIGWPARVSATMAAELSRARNIVSVEQLPTGTTRSLPSHATRPDRGHLFHFPSLDGRRQRPLIVFWNSPATQLDTKVFEPKSICLAARAAE